jgi:hypothetical protein
MVSMAFIGWPYWWASISIRKESQQGTSIHNFRINDLFVVVFFLPFPENGIQGFLHDQVDKDNPSTISSFVHFNGMVFILGCTESSRDHSG